MKILGAFCPFSKQFDSCDRFEDLQRDQKIKTIAVAIFFTLLSLPLFGILGVGAFRLMVDKYSFKNINDMPEKQRENYIKAINFRLDYKRKSLTEKFYCHKMFVKEAQAHLTKAVELHEAFLAEFKEEKQPQFDGKTGNAKSTLPQFKRAIEMAKKAFPGLTNLAYNTEQKTWVARLIQTIMCGDLSESPLPMDSCCFELSECENKTAKSVEIPEKEEKEKIVGSYYDHFIDNLKNQKSVRIDNIEYAIELFVSDCITRPGFRFSIGDVKIPLGLRIEDETIKINTSDFVKEIKNHYVDFLLKNSDKVKGIIDIYKNAGWYKALINENSLEDSIFPKIIVENLFKKHIEYHKNNQLIVNNINAICNNADIDEQTIEKIAEQSKLDKKEIEPLVRLKVVELLLIMHQGLLSNGGGGTQCSMLITEEGLYTNAPTITSYRDFIVDNSGSFDQLELSFPMDIVVTLGDFVAKKIYEPFGQDKKMIARIDILDKFEKLSALEARRTIIPMANLRLSWEASEQDIDSILSKFVSGN